MAWYINLVRTYEGTYIHNLVHTVVLTSQYLVFWWDLLVLGKTRGLGKSTWQMPSVGGAAPGLCHAASHAMPCPCHAEGQMEEEGEGEGEGYIVHNPRQLFLRAAHRFNTSNKTTQYRAGTTESSSVPLSSCLSLSSTVLLIDHRVSCDY